MVIDTLDSHSDVLVVGGGPAGSTVTALLAGAKAGRAALDREGTTAEITVDGVSRTHRTRHLPQRRRQASVRFSGGTARQALA